jgi:diaminohydroxyphosphoribosylaminopyrimidine deaminase/5-amino-6-(5-phosphoribosylamino)uracil reductase
VNASLTTSDAQSAHMDRALSLAERAVGSVSPNPPVGAVLVKDDEVVGEGWTQPPGQAHAEIVAIRQAGPKARGSTLYTTLEPCNHFGRTPPCTDAIIEAGIAEVRSAVSDPNPGVTGGGIARLTHAGVTTSVGDRADQGRRLIEGYVKFVTTGIPFVTAKFAMSLDGKIATRTGSSRWITGEEARAYAHEVRARSDAVMVGINTVLADDPQLTARDESGAPLNHQPLRVVVDSRGRTPSDARMLSEPGTTLIATADQTGAAGRRLSKHGAESSSSPAPDGLVDVDALLVLLGERGVTSVLVEGGSSLLGSFFDRALVDKVYAFIAPSIVGCAAAPSPVGGQGIERISDAMRLNDIEVMRLGADLAIVGYCEKRDDVHRNR